MSASLHSQSIFNIPNDIVLSNAIDAVPLSDIDSRVNPPL